MNAGGRNVFGYTGAIDTACVDIQEIRYLSLIKRYVAPVYNHLAIPVLFT